MAKKYIEAEDLMRRMYERAFETDGDTMWQSGCWVRYRAIEAVVKETPAADVEPRWIPVAERRPEVYGRYLVTLEYEGYRSVMPLYYGRINRIDTFYDSDSEYGDIEYCGAIAWMPLPTPYKGGEDE